jgi:hypothetical protein
VAKSPRGFRNHNPGNIRHGSQWQGLAELQPDPEFCTFVDPESGIRALARVLEVYQKKHKLNTVARIIARWAPPDGERPDGSTYQQATDRYVAYVANALGVAPGQAIDVTRPMTMRALVAAIIRHENGRGPLPTTSTWYAEDVLDAGLRAAGFALPKPLAKSKTLAGNTLTGAGVAGNVALEQAAPLFADVGEQAQGAANTLLPMAEASAVLRLLCIALMVGGIALSVYGYLQIRRRANEAPHSPEPLQ